MEPMQRLVRTVLVGLVAIATLCSPSSSSSASPEPHGGSGVQKHRGDNPAVAQFCVDAWDAQGPKFCMAATMYHNHSTSAHDMLMTVEVHRPSNPNTAALGWLAVGTGAVMSGSLMFVVYGDPLARRGPFVSARGVQLGHGHAQPDVLSATDPRQNSGVLVQQLSGGWKTTGQRDDGTHVGVVELACYGCDAWNGHAVSPEETSQAMIWAFNADEDMAPYAWDQPLRKHAGANGWGGFYANLHAATTHHASGPPTVTHDADKINTSSSHIIVEKPSFFDRLRERPAAHVHGFIMGVAFLVLFPLGVVGIRSGRANAFRYHWTLQAGAIVLATAGAGLGISMSGGHLLGSAHQRIGLAVCALLSAQAASGWWHHVRFVRIRRRTWVSYAHMALGWAILLGGWANVVTGSVLYGLGRLGLFVLVVLIATELMALAVVVHVARRKRRQEMERAKAKAAAWTEDHEESFVLGDVDSEVDDEEEDEDTTERKSDEKLRPAKYHK